MSTEAVQLHSGRRLWGFASASEPASAPHRADVGEAGPSGRAGLVLEQWQAQLCIVAVCPGRRCVRVPILLCRFWPIHQQWLIQRLFVIDAHGCEMQSPGDVDSESDFVQYICMHQATFLSGTSPFFRTTRPTVTASRCPSTGLERVRCILHCGLTLLARPCSRHADASISRCLACHAAPAF